MNTSDADLKYLAISANQLADVVLYPDPGKICAVSKVFSKQVWHFSKLASGSGYYDGEE